MSGRARRVRSAAVHAISLADVALTRTLSWTADLMWRTRSTAGAFSCVVGVVDAETVFTFLPLPLPAPHERLRGTLKEQSRILREEPDRLKKILTI